MRLQAGYETAVIEAAQQEVTPAAEPARDAAHEVPALRTTEIAPIGSWQAINLRELWRHRELLFFLVWRDVKVRYKQTALGVAWAVLQPAMMTVMFTLTIARLAKLDVEGMAYPMFAYLGFMSWQLFAGAVSNSSNSVVSSEQLITKVYFPRLMIPFAAAGTSLVDFGASSLLMIGMLAWYGVMPGWQVVFMPVVLMVLMMTALGVGTLMAALNVAFRDFRHIIPFFMQFWMMGTVTIYSQPKADTGGSLHWVIMLNPVTHLVSAFRACMTGGSIDFASLGIVASVGMGLFVVGCLVFRRMEQRFADII